MARAFIFVLDSFGIGGARDAAAFGDQGSDTLGHIAEACLAGKGDREGLRKGPLRLPQMEALGLGRAAEIAAGKLPAGFSASLKPTGFSALPTKFRAARIRRPAIGRSRPCRSPSTGAIFRSLSRHFRQI